MLRREFLGTMAGLVKSPGTVLQAIAAPTLPSYLRVPLRLAPDDPRYFELRVYDGPVLLPVLERAGIDALGHWSGAYLFAFDSLEARQQAWTTIATDSEWAKYRHKTGRVTRLEIYRLPGQQRL
jgi:hypothetical protein